MADEILAGELRKRGVQRGYPEERESGASAGKGACRCDGESSCCGNAIGVEEMEGKGEHVGRIEESMGVVEIERWRGRRLSVLYKVYNDMLYEFIYGVGLYLYRH